LCLFSSTPALSSLSLHDALPIFLWPILANRVSNFEKAKIQSGWAGIYSHNTEDQNAIIGEHLDLSGYHLAVGFSGHGMQQAPAVDRKSTRLNSSHVSSSYAVFGL